MASEVENSRVLEQLQVLRAQTGDSEAYCELFQKHNRKLLYYLRRIIEEPTEAEDVLQEVWLTVLRKIAALNEPHAFRTWLYRIARNHAISHLRKKRRAADLDSVDQLNLASQSDLIDDDDESMSQYDAVSVHQAMNELSTHHREVLTLRFLEQMSYEEIANVVSCSVGTIRSRIHYAKKILKETLIQQIEEK